MGRTSLITAVVLVVGVLVACTQPGASSGPQTTPISSPTAPRTDDGQDSRPIAVFIGDSYTQGVGATSSDLRWSTLLAAEEGWTEVNLGRGGTGYVTTSGVSGCGLEYCPSYPEMLAELPAEVDIAVIAGGQNDFTAWTNDHAAVTAAIDATLTGLREALPEARIIVVGPSTPGEVVPTVTGMSAAVQRGAAGIAASFVSLIDPPVLSAALLAADGAHPNDEGHKAIADRVAAGIAGS